MFPCQNPVSTSNDNEELFYVTIQNTSGKTLCKWYPPPKTNDIITPINLLIFLREDLGIPFNFLILYLGDQSLSYKIGIQDNRWHDEEILVSNRPAVVKIALRNYCNGGDQIVIDKLAKKFDLMQARCVKIIEDRSKAILIENILDLSSINGQRHWLKCVQSLMYRNYGLISSKYTLKLVDDIVNLNKSGNSTSTRRPLKSFSRLEDLFFSSNIEEFKEIVYLELSLVGGCLDEEKRKDFYFSILKVETLVLKSLTRVEKLKMSDYKFFHILQDFIDRDWKIPKHLQVYMHHGQEIQNISMFVDLFLDHGTSEEKLNRCLILNLISKEPNFINIDLECPYDSSHTQRLGVPQTIRIKETATLMDVEKALLETTKIQFTVYPPVETYQELYKAQLQEKNIFFNDQDFNLPKDEMYIYELERKCIGSFFLQVFRNVNVQIQRCDDCQSPEPFQKTFSIALSDVSVKDVENKFSVDFPNGFCCHETKLKFLVEPDNSISLRSNVLVVEDNQVLNFKAVKRSLSTRFKQFLGLKK
uniref:Uncharacterized protein n=1 Tax=Clytia hemisphaerica TaxID=252671 RepID=A0A7M5V744_9CNID